MEHIIIVVFICRENPRRSGIWLFPDCLIFRRLTKTRNRRSPRSSGMDGTGTNLENRKRFYFPDTSQISAMVGDHFRHSNLYRRVRRRWISLIRQSPNEYEFLNEISDFAYCASVLRISTFSSRPVKFHQKLEVGRTKGKFRSFNAVSFRF